MICPIHGDYGAHFNECPQCASEGHRVLCDTCGFPCRNRFGITILCGCETETKKGGENKDATTSTKSSARKIRIGLEAGKAEPVHYGKSDIQNAARAGARTNDATSEYHVGLLGSAKRENSCVSEVNNAAAGTSDPSSVAASETPRTDAIMKLIREAGDADKFEAMHAYRDCAKWAIQRLERELTAARAEIARLNQLLSGQ